VLQTYCCYNAIFLDHVLVYDYVHVGHLLYYSHYFSEHKTEVRVFECCARILAADTLLLYVSSAVHSTLSIFPLTETCRDGQASEGNASAYRGRWRLFRKESTNVLSEASNAHYPC
jgi:hypothetical protein